MHIATRWGQKGSASIL